MPKPMEPLLGTAMFGWGKTTSEADSHKIWPWWTAGTSSRPSRQQASEAVAVSTTQPAGIQAPVLQHKYGRLHPAPVLQQKEGHLSTARVAHPAKKRSDGPAAAKDWRGHCSRSRKRSNICVSRCRSRRGQRSTTPLARSWCSSSHVSSMRPWSRVQLLVKAVSSSRYVRRHRSCHWSRQGTHWRVSSSKGRRRHYNRNSSPRPSCSSSQANKCSSLRWAQYLLGSIWGQKRSCSCNSSRCSSSSVSSWRSGGGTNMAWSTPSTAAEASEDATTTAAATRQAAASTTAPSIAARQLQQQLQTHPWSGDTREETAATSVNPVKEHVNWSAATEAKQHKATAAGTAVAVQATGRPWRGSW